MTLTRQPVKWAGRRANPRKRAMDGVRRCEVYPDGRTIPDTFLEVFHDGPSASIFGPVRLRRVGPCKGDRCRWADRHVPFRQSRSVAIYLLICTHTSGSVAESHCSGYECFIRSPTSADAGEGLTRLMLHARNAVVRHARLSDIPRLMELEELCW